jgi:hypothetical protein
MASTRPYPGRRGATSPVGPKAAMSTPQGTTVMRRVSPPRRRSSKTSSVAVAMTWSAVSRMRSSTARRSGGLVSAGPCSRRLTMPSA